MSEQTKTNEVVGDLWVDDPVEELGREASVRLQVERTGEDEIAIHALRKIGDTHHSLNAASMYVSRANAALIAAQLLAEASVGGVR